MSMSPFPRVGDLSAPAPADAPPRSSADAEFLASFVKRVGELPGNAYVLDVQIRDYRAETKTIRHASWIEFVKFLLMGALAALVVKFGARRLGGAVGEV